MILPEIGAPEIDAGNALFLDVDGTLLEFADTPDAVLVPPELPRLLGELAELLDGALAVVSGRTIEQIDRVLRPVILPAAGQHGAEWRLHAAAPILSAQPAAEIGRLHDILLRLVAARDDLFLEPKPFSIAVHYRGAGDGLAAQLRDAMAAAGAIGWQVLTARQAFEVKRSNVDKGLAIQRFLAEPPFRGRIPVFLGDDLTDEDGFAVVLAAGGCAVRVGPEERPSLAAMRLTGPRAVLGWLKAQSAKRNQGNPR